MSDITSAGLRDLPDPPARQACRLRDLRVRPAGVERRTDCSVPFCAGVLGGIRCGPIAGLGHSEILGGHFEPFLPMLRW